jgi:hypothetical protein
MSWHNTYLPIQPIIQPTAIHPGGLCSIVAIPIQHIQSWPQPNPQTGIIDDEITLLPGKQFFTIYCVDKDRRFTEELKYSKAGPFLDINISLMVPGNVVDTTISLAEKQYHRWLLIAKDKNGEYRLIGSQDAGAILTYDYSSGDMDSSRRRNIKFTWQHSGPAPIYKGSLVGLLPANSTIMLIERFKVKDTGTPMTTGQYSYTNESLANRKLWLIINREKVPEQVNDMIGEQYVEKPLSSNTFTIKSSGLPSGVNLDDIIEIYAHT